MNMTALQSYIQSCNSTAPTDTDRKCTSEVERSQELWQNVYKQSMDWSNKRVHSFYTTL